jgi:uncharacterized protein (DUF488 family)
VTRVFTIGYEHILPPALVAELQHAGVERVLDVRYRPQSRRAGMSKTRLGELLAEHGIAYEHRRSLGTPPDIRFLFKHRQVAEGREAYRAHIEAHADGELDALLGELRDGPATALLCLEEDPAECHRRVICEALAEREPGLVVIDL